MITIFEYTHKTDLKSFVKDGMVTSAVETVKDKIRSFISKHTRIIDNNIKYKTEHDFQLSKFIVLELDGKSLDPNIFKKGILDFNEIKSKYPAIFNDHDDLCIRFDEPVDRLFLLPIGVHQYGHVDQMFKYFYGYVLGLENVSEVASLLMDDIDLSRKFDFMDDRVMAIYTKQLTIRGFDRYMYQKNIGNDIPFTLTDDGIHKYINPEREYIIEHPVAGKDRMYSRNEKNVSQMSIVEKINYLTSMYNYTYEILNGEVIITKTNSAFVDELFDYLLREHSDLFDNELEILTFFEIPHTRISLDPVTIIRDDGIPITYYKTFIPIGNLSTTQRFIYNGYKRYLDQ